MFIFNIRKQVCDVLNDFFILNEMWKLKNQ
jgi:hypothetical protein